MDKPLIMVKYKTADGNEICIDVSKKVKKLLAQSDRQIRSQRRKDRRHIDFREFVDEFTNTTTLCPHQSDTADLVIKMDSSQRLYKAINELSELQRRRLLLHFVDERTYRQIAEIEGVNFRTIEHTVKRALALLRKQLDN